MRSHLRVMQHDSSERQTRRRQTVYLVSVSPHQPLSGPKCFKYEPVIVCFPWLGSGWTFKHVPACIKKPMNSNVALASSMLCECAAHNVLQQQDRHNYHNQRKGASISGEPWGVNEAERRRKQKRWISQGDREEGKQGRSSCMARLTQNCFHIWKWFCE